MGAHRHAFFTLGRLPPAMGPEWQPLPREVADWMGMDETMVLHAAELAVRVPAVPQPSAPTPKSAVK